MDVQDVNGSEERASGLESAASFIRHRLAQVLPLRRVPALDFRYDVSIALGSETLSLLRSLNDDEPT